jgi:hypothetical protein
MADKKDIVALFRKNGATLGLDDNSSDVIIQNLNAGTIPMCIGSPFTAEEEETDQFKIILFVLDGSGSMSYVEDMLIKEFNETVIPSLKEAKKSVVTGIRIGGLVFNNAIYPLWGGGFQPLDNIPKLTKAKYQARGATALFQAVLDGLTATAAYALEIRKKTGTNPEVIVITMSDGANNMPPNDPDIVYQVTSRLSRELFTLAFAGFETEERVDFKQIAQDIGFPEIFEMKMVPGETDEDRRRRFRHLIGIMSSTLVGQVAKTAGGQTGGFWQP